MRAFLMGKKSRTFWGPCDLRVVTGHRAGLGLRLGCGGRNCRSVARQTRSQGDSRREYWPYQIGVGDCKTLYCSALVRGRAEDKLGTMCCVGTGRGDGWSLGGPVAACTPEPAFFARLEPRHAQQPCPSLSLIVGSSSPAVVVVVVAAVLVVLKTPLRLSRDCRNASPLCCSTPYMST